MRFTNPQNLDVVVVEKKDIRTKRPVFVAGFTTGGLVGNIAARHLVTFLGMNEIAHLESKLIPSSKIVAGSELKTIYPFRIFINSSGDLMTLIEAAVPGTVSSAVFWSVAKALVDWLKKKGVREVIFLEASLARGKEVHNVYAYSAYSQRLQELREFGVEILREGLIAGIVASMIDRCAEQKIPWLVLFTTIKKATEPDPQAATKILDTLNEILGLKIDTKLFKTRKKGKWTEGLLRSLGRL